MRPWADLFGEIVYRAIMTLEFSQPPSQLSLELLILLGEDKAILPSTATVDIDTVELALVVRACRLLYPYFFRDNSLGWIA